MADIQNSFLTFFVSSFLSRVKSQRNIFHHPLLKKLLAISIDRMRVYIGGLSHDCSRLVCDFNYSHFSFTNKVAFHLQHGNMEVEELYLDVRAAFNLVPVEDCSHRLNRLMAM